MFNNYNQSSISGPDDYCGSFSLGDDSFIANLDEQEFKIWSEAVEVGTEIEDSLSKTSHITY